MFKFKCGGFLKHPVQKSFSNSSLWLFWPRRLACVMCICVRLACLGHCYHYRSVLFSLFISPSSAFDPLRGNSRVWKFVSPNILAYLEDKCKKIFILVINFFYEKKMIIDRFLKLFSQFSQFCSIVHLAQYHLLWL